MLKFEIHTNLSDKKYNFFYEVDRIIVTNHHTITQIIALKILHPQEASTKYKEGESKHKSLQRRAKTN